MPRCNECGDTYPAARAALGYKTCLSCGEAEAAKLRAGWTVVPLHKGNYTRVTRKEELKQLNQKAR